jgi:hypothetical protein
VEFTKSGEFVREFNVDASQGGAFGIATVLSGYPLFNFAAVDDVSDGISGASADTARDRRSGGGLRAAPVVLIRPFYAAPGQRLSRSSATSSHKPARRWRASPPPVAAVSAPQARKRVSAAAASSATSSDPPVGNPISKKLSARRITNRD